MILDFGKYYTSYIYFVKMKLPLECKDLTITTTKKHIVIKPSSKIDNLKIKLCISSVSEGGNMKIILMKTI